MKFRFRTMKDGQVRRWRAGKRHNAHLKVNFQANLVSMLFYQPQ